MYANSRMLNTPWAQWSSKLELQQLEIVERNVNKTHSTMSTMHCPWWSLIWSIESRLTHTEFFIISKFFKVVGPNGTLCTSVFPTLRRIRVATSYLAYSGRLHNTLVTRRQRHRRYMASLSLSLCCFCRLQLQGEKDCLRFLASTGQQAYFEALIFNLSQFGGDLCSTVLCRLLHVVQQRKWEPPTAEIAIAYSMYRME